MVSKFDNFPTFTVKKKITNIKVFDARISSLHKCETFFEQLGKVFPLNMFKNYDLLLWYVNGYYK